MPRRPQRRTSIILSLLSTILPDSWLASHGQPRDTDAECDQTV